MPAFAIERDDRDAFLVECETLSASKPPSPGASGDFSKDSRLSSYGSTASAASAASAALSSSEAPTAPASPTPLASTLPKDPEQWPLLGGVLPPPGGFSRGGGVPSGLTAAEILPLANDPFWCRLRAALFGLFWVVIVALLAVVVVIVVNDPTPCAPRPPTPLPLPPQHQTFNVSLPIGALPVLQAVAASRY